MGLILGRSVEVQIYNKTRNITLENPRTYFDFGLCSKPPHPFVPPGSTESSFFPGSFPFQGVAGILVYEATSSSSSFSLAVHFCNPINYNIQPMGMGLELSPRDDHKNLEVTYARMAEGRSSTCPAARCDHVILTKSHGTAQVANGPLRVTASMSNTKNVVLKVVLEEQGALREEAQVETPNPGKHVQEK